MEYQITEQDIESTRKLLIQNEQDRKIRAALEEKYPVLHPNRLPRIVPKWDLSTEALKYNDLRDEILVGLTLHLAEPSAFLGVCTYPSDYATEDLERRSSTHKLRRILDLWESEVALTPPVFTWQDEKLVKLDGHHRTLLAFALQASEIPFYCDRPIEDQGIRVHRSATK